MLRLKNSKHLLQYNLLISLQNILIYLKISKVKKVFLSHTLRISKLFKQMYHFYDNNPATLLKCYQILYKKQVSPLKDNTERNV